MSSPDPAAKTAKGKLAKGKLPARALWRLAWRGVSRNRRRSLLSLLAVALGLALLIVMNGMIAGVVDDMLRNTVQLDTGHVQLRAPGYDADALSLRPSEMIDELDARLARARAQDGVEAASPVIWIRGLLTGPDDVLSLRLIGIDPASELHNPFRDAVVDGAYLSADDRDGILIGRPVAENLGVTAGERVNVAVLDADGVLDEGAFTVRGVFATGIPAFDQSSAFMPLLKAQAFGQNRGRASAIVIMLEDPDTAPAVAAALAQPGVEALTWSDLNEFIVQYLATAARFYWILDAIVMLVVAVVIANTLLMAVFERIREMGILASLGMRGGQMRALFMLEALVLGVAGCALGIVLGVAGVWWMALVGIDFGDEFAASAGDLALNTVIRASFEPLHIILLTAWTLAIILLASLYPARFAAGMEPVEALRRS